MIVTKTQLRKIIKEEIENVQREGLKGGSLAGGHPLRWLRYVLTSDEPMNAMNAWFDKQEQIRTDFEAALDRRSDEPVVDSASYERAYDKAMELKNAEKDPIDAYYEAKGGAIGAGSLPTKMAKALTVYNKRERQHFDEWRELFKKATAIGEKFGAQRVAARAKARQDAEEKRHREIMAKIDKERSDAREKAQAKQRRERDPYKDKWSDDDEHLIARL